METLALIFRKPSRENAFMVHTINALAFLVLSVFVFMAYRSSHSPEPVALTDVVVRVATKDLNGGLQITETRRFVGFDVETLGVMRSLYAQTDPSKAIALEGGLFTAQTGPFTTSTIIHVPPTIQGMWCLKTSYNWWPSWSQREYLMTTPDICFETTPDA